jgi:hypothetical protein
LGERIIAAIAFGSSLRHLSDSSRQESGQAHAAVELDPERIALPPCAGDRGKNGTDKCAAVLYGIDVDLNRAVRKESVERLLDPLHRYSSAGGGALRGPEHLVAV